MGKQGALVCVGVGMMLGAHLTPRARAEIEHAEVVFALVSDPLVELWLQELRPDMRSLQVHYGSGGQAGKPRDQSYREMIAAMLDEVRAGRRVCGAFYGHPGVFAVVPHRAIAQAAAEGHEARMEPGISAEDCLYADLGIDPGTHGCQHVDASQFLWYRHQVDPCGYLVLWQVGVAGDHSLRSFGVDAAHIGLLADRLLRDYPLEHEVIAYEAATLPIARPRMERMRLGTMASAQWHLHTTLVVPPARVREVEAVAQRGLVARQENIHGLDVRQPSDEGEEHVESDPVSGIRGRHSGAVA